MRHEWTDIISVDGFRSGETDFAQRLAAAEQRVRDAVDDVILSALMNSPGGVLLLIAGHSDRVDTGESHQACLAQETKASQDRAVSADKALLEMLSRDWLSAPVTEWGELPWVGVVTVGFGATHRRDTSGTDAGRLLNRRVDLAVCRFVE